MEKPSVEYIAGLFDGEGCVSIYRVTAKDYRRPKYQLQVCVVIREGWLLRILQGMFGGSVRREHRKKATHAPVSRWRLGDFKAVDFLEQVEPYLLLKREGALIALHFRKHSGNSKRHILLSQQIREDCYWALRFCNRRGVERAA